MNASVKILTDVTFGDAGKGSLTDYYARTENAHTVIRYNGGPQAAHNVHTDDGRHHTFAQFCSGTFAGAKTHLSRFMLIEPIALLAEERHLRTVGIEGALEKLTIDPHATVITPFHRAGNRLRELARGKNRHGSCGMGIGETVADKIASPDAALLAADLKNPRRLLEKLRHFQNHKRTQMAELNIPDSPTADQEMSLLTDPRAPEEFAALFAHAAAQINFTDTAEILAQDGTVIFEGAQGVLLDAWQGFHPFTTWSNTTFENALALCAEANIPQNRIRKIGITRAYATRHGPGPFPTEDAALTRAIPDTHNIHNAWQRTFRVGHLDLMLLQYANIAAGNADELAVTCVDRLAEIGELKIATAYESLEEIPFKPAPNRAHQEFLTALLTAARPIYKTVAPENLLSEIENFLRIPITLTSHGVTAQDKLARSELTLL